MNKLIPSYSGLRQLFQRRSVSSKAVFRSVIKKSKSGRVTFRTDPNAPAKPLSAYISYVNDTRPTNLSKDELMAFIKECGTKWTQLQDDTKKKYVDKYEKEMEGFTDLYAKYIYSEDALEYTQKKIDALKKLRFPADPNAPKRALSSYFIFITDPGMVVEFTGPAPARVKILSEKWNNFTAEQKKPFEERSAELKAEYDKVREEYIGTAEYDQYNAQKRAWTYQRNQRIKKLQTDLKKQQMGDMGVSDDDMVSSWEAKKAKQ
eukprot:182575_1